MAITREGKPVFADNFNEQEWQALKDSYSIGELLLPCCMAPAIPKTSQKYIQFFAHYSDECASSPESQWHLASKEDVIKELCDLGIDAVLEKNGGNRDSKWKADVFIEYKGRKIAIEIQHSYQHLRDYFKRQEIYVKSGIEAYWLLYQPRYMTLTGSLQMHRIKNEFGGKPPNGGFYPCVPKLPIAYYDISDEQRMVKGARLFQATLADWLKSIIDQKFQYEAGAWVIV